MEATPNDPAVENTQIGQNPDNVFVKMMKRKRIVQEHIRAGQVAELTEKGIKVVQPI